MDGRGDGSGPGVSIASGKPVRPSIHTDKICTRFLSCRLAPSATRTHRRSQHRTCETSKAAPERPGHAENEPQRGQLDSDPWHHKHLRVFVVVMALADSNADSNPD